MNRYLLPSLVLTSLVLGSVLIAQQAAPDPWTASDLVSPATLARNLAEKTKPQILYVGFPVLYRAAHIPGAILAGPASKPEGLETLRKALASIPKNQTIVVYCGCCPWDKCPNIRPAFQLIKQLGYQQAKLVTIPTNVHTDWTSKGYPVERAADKQ